MRNVGHVMQDEVEKRIPAAEIGWLRMIAGVSRRNGKEMMTLDRHYVAKQHC